MVSDLALGLAAEHLVCADLLLNGYNAYVTSQNSPYDIALDYNKTVVRIQVKSTSNIRKVPQRVNDMPAYLWNVRRAGKKGIRRYGVTEFDILALVAVDIKTIAYFTISDTVKQTIILHPPGTISRYKKHKLKNIDQYPFTEALSGFTR